MYQDKNGTPLNIGDYVIADTNGARGKIVKRYNHYYACDEVCVSWNGIYEKLDNITMSHIIKPKKG